MTFFCLFLFFNCLIIIINFCSYLRLCSHCRQKWPNLTFLTICDLYLTFFYDSLNSKSDLLEQTLVTFICGPRLDTYQMFCKLYQCKQPCCISSDFYVPEMRPLEETGPGKIKSTTQNNLISAKSQNWELRAASVTTALDLALVYRHKCSFVLVGF